jgi:hypothetical protein
MCITLGASFVEHWKSFMKFGIKRSHGMPNHILAWIALVSE